MTFVNKQTKPALMKSVKADFAPIIGS